MSTICNKNCKYRKAVYCGLEYTMLNQFGQCLVWFDKNGNLRRTPDYRYDEAPIQNDIWYRNCRENEESENPTEEPKNDDSESEKSEENNET